jgi:hypothetical protein
MSAASPNGELKNAPVPVARPVTALEQRRRLLLALPLPRGPVAVAGGVTAGAVVVALVRALRGRRARAGRRRRRELRRTVVGTRSFLVDVHLLGR